MRGNLRGGRRWRIQNVLNRSHSGDRLFGEDAQLQREGSCELAVKVHRAPAHAGDDPRVLHLRPFQLNQNDGLLGAEEIVQHADDFQVELLNLVPGKDRVSISLHSGPNLGQGKGFRRLLGFKKAGNQAQCGEERKESEEKSSGTIRQMRPGRKHERSIIRGTRTRGNWTPGGCPNRKIQLGVLEPASLSEAFSVVLVYDNVDSVC